MCYLACKEKQLTSETPGLSFPQYHKFSWPEALGDSDWQGPIIQHQLLEKYSFLFLLILQKKKIHLASEKNILSAKHDFCTW